MGSTEALPAVAPVAEPPPVLTLDQVRPLLGNANRRTIRRWMNNGRNPLPAYRPPGGRKLLFLKEDVLRWIHENRILPSAETPRALKKRTAKRGGGR
jgi:excisionase family DNA binding protein